MKRIINGKTYNTDTANKVFFGYLDAEDTSLQLSLYQTRHGEFFKAVTNVHEKETLEFGPITDAEAQALVERHANDLVEQYFGEMPEGGAAERRLTIRIPGNLADRLESLAQAHGLSLNSYAMRCFERCALADGQPAVQG
ncbi:hypothetical protein [Caballeronia grimmiae]|uniref:hypothetical protein n=1 Tax=Caballeronia grimmiae TaxID=1071679 RepID=UPI0038BA70CE